jgi:autotransporter-associated beta strand protein
MVTVGAGGVSTAVGVTNGTVLAQQNGGASKFSSEDLMTDYALAIGGGGGKNAVSTGSGNNQGGVTTSTSGCIGDSLFAGGGGGAAGATNSGGGGGGAGDAGNGGTPTANSTTGGTAGNAGGGSGAGGRPLNNAGLAGSAPGGGGSGGARNSLNGNYIGGAGGDGTVVLTYTINLGVDHYAVTADVPQVAPYQTACAPFNVTITAQDITNATVPDIINIVTMTSPDGSLMEFDWNLDDIYGDNSGTLIPSTLDVIPVNGQRTIRARNKKAEEKTIVATSGFITTSTPPSVTTAAAAFVKLQVLAPGETAAPGSATGKAGTPSPQIYGASFDLTVNGVDEFWNLVNTVTDTVAITTTAPASLLPTDAPLVDGTGLFAVTLNTVGSFKLTATDVTDGSKSSDTTPSIVVQPVNFVWAGDGVANQWDTATPNWNSPYGTGVVFVPGNNAVFDATSSNLTVDIVGSVTAATISAGSALEYTLGSTSGGSITGATAINKSGSGRLILSTTNDHTGNNTIFGNGKLRAAATQALGSGTITINGGSGNNGGLELIGGISLNNPVSFSTKISAEGPVPGIRNISGDNTLSNTIGTFTNGDYFMIQSDAGLLTLGTTGQNAFTLWGGKQLILQGAGNGLFAGNITSGPGSQLTKAGAGTWTLAGSTSHSSATTINGGTLALGASGTMTASNALSIAAGATFNTSLVASHVIPATRPLTFGINATDAGTSGMIVAAGLDISAAVVTAYNITGDLDDPAYVLATYTSLDGISPSFASVPTPPDGYTLDYTYQGNKIALVSASDPYETWAGAGVLFDDDANNDGVDNGLAWLLGASGPNVNSLDKLPAVTALPGGGLKMTFEMLPTAARGTAQLYLEHSGDLGISDSWASVLVLDATGGAVPVTFVVTDSDLVDLENPLVVEATISSSEAIASKLFGRLRGEK